MLRWSWRDLRRRWGLVLLTACIVALGTGTYAGLGGTTAWRLLSNDASYARLRYHDLRIRLPERTTSAQGDLAERVRSTIGADAAAVEERLVVPVQVDASVGSRTVLVQGEVVGAPPDSRIDTLHVEDGRLPGATGEVLLDSKFATARHLRTRGQLAVSGGHRVAYTGTGYGPEYFRVIGSGQQLTGEMGFAVLFAPLATAQALTSNPGHVNDAIVRLRAGASADAAARRLRAAFADQGAKVETRADDTVRRTLYADARNDETMWAFLSLLVLLGASFAAFNLISRMVDAERHEIGVGMAIGAPPRRLAVRPLLAGFQIAALGAVLGVAVGVYAGWAMRQVLLTALPLPVWRTPFQLGRYAQAAVLGITLPMIATAIPVWRALRVEPVDALRSTAAGSRARAGWAPRLARRRRGRHVVSLMPFRNMARSPRRTVLTSLGIAAAITTLVAVLGMIDSIYATLARSDAEVARMHAGRLEVALTDFGTAGSPNVTAVTRLSVIGRAEPGLRVSGTLRRAGVKVDTILDVVDFRSALWRPSVTAGNAPVGRPGLVISEKAAADLGVRPGDRVTLRHPVRDGASYRLADTVVPVAGLHPNPIRFFTYLDSSQVDLLGLRGIVDRVVVEPAKGRSADDVKRALFEQSGVAAVEDVGVLGQTIEHRMSQLTGILRVLEAFALGLALLIAVNSATLAIEERRREQATMFAFGLPVSRVMATIMTETAATALLGTVLGIGGGLLALGWLLRTFTTETLPELGVPTVLTSGTIVAVVLLGVGVTTCAPLFSLRRLRRADIPSTLRVLE